MGRKQGGMSEDIEAWCLAWLGGEGLGRCWPSEVLEKSRLENWAEAEYEFVHFVLLYIFVNTISI